MDLNKLKQKAAEKLEQMTGGRLGGHHDAPGGTEHAPGAADRAATTDTPQPDEPREPGDRPSGTNLPEGDQTPAEFVNEPEEKPNETPLERDGGPERDV